MASTSGTSGLQPPVTPRSAARPLLTSTPANRNSHAAAASLHIPLAPDVRELLIKDVSNFLRGSAKRWLHSQLSRLNAIPRPEDDKQLDIDKDLRTCLAPIIDLMDKEEDRFKTIRSELESYAKTPTETVRYKHFVLAGNTSLELLQRLKIHHSQPPVAFEHPNSVLFMRHDMLSMQSDHNEPAIVLGYRRDIAPRYHDPTSEPLDSQALLKAVTGKPQSRLEWTEKLGPKELKSPPEISKWKDPTYELKEFDVISRSDLAEAIARTAKENAGEGAALPASESPKQAGGSNQGGGKKRSASQAELDAIESEKKKPRTRETKKPMDSKQWQPKPVSLPDLTEEHPVVQLADYIAEANFNTFGRDNAMGLLISGSVLNVWVYDHECPIQLGGFDFIQDFPYFLLFLFVLQRFTRTDWGFLPQFDDLNRRAITDHKAMKLAEEEAKKIEKEGGVKIDVGKKAEEIIEKDKTRTVDLSSMFPGGKSAIFKCKKGDEVPTRFGLNGRSTGVKRGKLFVYDEKGKLTVEREVALKLSWGEMSRLRESAILEKARKGFKGKTFPEGYDPQEFLPEIIAEQVFHEFDTRIRRKAILHDSDYKAYELERPLARRCPVLVLMPKYEPIGHITTLTEIERVDFFLSLIYCHVMLWSVGVEHGDISEGNLMYDKKDKKPKLCDFDLSHVSDQERPSGHSNTGTWAFMAMELLTQKAMDGRVPRLYRHDFESFIAVLVWVVFRYRDGKLVPDPPLEEWVQNQYEMCGVRRKHTFDEISTGSLAGPTSLSPAMWGVIVNAVTFLQAYIGTREGLSGNIRLMEAAARNRGPDEGVPLTVNKRRAPEGPSLAKLKEELMGYDGLTFLDKVLGIELFSFPGSKGTFFADFLDTHIDDLKKSTVS
ncbi:hypothetical protein D9611_000694 [Ephemerocybe angulata]|uniref:Protein kinase domain-containing protein n=1 Tax=Ephemerocybe angulata TaxID=980116 RepID=A0A8H5F761_9AGAR|nr:hypothetical protein D9611_000694 [Tulosesus angulatus]